MYIITEQHNRFIVGWSRKDIIIVRSANEFVVDYTMVNITVYQVDVVCIVMHAGWKCKECFGHN